MARGDAARRRRKVQERAALLKGKTLSGAQKKQAGQEPKQIGQDMTRAMKKMLQLKAAAQTGKGKALPPQRQGNNQRGTAAPSAAQHGAQQQSQGQQQSIDQSQQQMPSQAQAPAGNAMQQQQRRQQQQEQQLFAQKRLKDRKKEFLQKKKLKKKGRGGDTLVTDKEAELAARQAASAPAFGEQAYQPLKVQLKRKHWAGEGAEAGRASKRCTEIFNRQMAEAARAAAAAEAARDDGAVQAVQQRPKGAAGKGRHKGKAAGKGQAQADEETRQQLIEAYRLQKQQRLEATGKVPLLSATTQSLAALVAREAGRVAAADAQ